VTSWPAVYAVVAAQVDPSERVMPPAAAVPLDATGTCPAVRVPDTVTPPTRPSLAATKAVVASLVLESAPACVGAVALPVSAGDASGA